MSEKPTICTEEGCRKVPYLRSLCRAHYRRFLHRRELDRERGRDSDPSRLPLLINALMEIQGRRREWERAYAALDEMLGLPLGRGEFRRPLLEIQVQTLRGTVEAALAELDEEYGRKSREF